MSHNAASSAGQMVFRIFKVESLEWRPEVYIWSGRKVNIILNLKNLMVTFWMGESAFSERFIFFKEYDQIVKSEKSR